LSAIAVKFGPFDIFAMTVVALSLIAAVSQGSLLAGLISAPFGAMLSLPGIDPISGSIRLTFGFSSLDNGLTLLPVILGMLVLGQVLIDCEGVLSGTKAGKAKARVSMHWRDVTNYLMTYIRSSFIGTWIGILPGVGGTAASVASYSVAKAASKTPEKFGNGAEEGIIAAETANNAGTVGALVPLITLGIPGSVITAVLLGAMVIHNLNPGPLLFAENPDVAYTIIAGALAGNLAMFLIMVVATPFLAKLAHINKAYLLAPIVVFCMIGAFSVSSRFFDIGVMLVFACLGYVMTKARIPTGAFIIAYILTPMAEQNLRSGLVIYDGSFLPLITNPVSGILLAIAVLSIVWSLRSELKLRKKQKVS